MYDPDDPKCKACPTEVQELCEAITLAVMLAEILEGVSPENLFSELAEIEEVVQ